VVGLLRAAAFAAGAAIVLILAFLAAFTLPLLQDGGLLRLLTWDWRPDRGQHGVLPMVVGSLLLATAAMLLALPLAIGVCLFVHGLGPRRLGRLLFAVVAFMTGIPTVVYAFVAVLYLVPLVRQLSHGAGSGYSLLAAACTLALLVLPTLVLVIDASWRGIAPSLLQTGEALGLSRTQVLLHLVLPLSWRGLAVAAVLAFGRAIGDTMIALLVAGNAAQLPHSPLDPVRALTAHIALVFEVDTQSQLYWSIFACGLILLLVTAAVNLAARWLGPQPATGAQHAG
jgi:phosphate transport system permease protein